MIEDRSQFIGASEVGAVLGVDPYKTRLQLYEEKVGTAQPFEGNRHTRRGNWFEAAAAELYMEQTGRKVHRMNQRIVHPEYPFITCRVDRRIVGEKRIIEIKCPSLGSFSKIKREGLHEGYIAQLHQMTGLTVSEGGDWAIFSADQYETVIFPVDHDAKLYTEIVARVVDFWESYVLKRVPPPAEYADEERIELQRAEGTSKLYTLTDPAEIEALVNFRDAKRIKADAETLEEDAKAHVQQIVGENFGIYTASGIRLAYSQVAGRSSFDQKALAGAKPLDRIKVGVALTPLFNRTTPVDPAEIEAAIAEVGKADLDITQFAKRGSPYTTMRLSETRD